MAVGQLLDAGLRGPIFLNATRKKFRQVLDPTNTSLPLKKPLKQITKARFDGLVD